MLDEALEVLREYGDSACILAGGQSLLPQLKARSLTAECVVDINRVAELDSITEDRGALTVGALVRFSDAASDPLLKSRYTALADAAGAVGDRQVRNRGTLVGSLVFAAHWGDIAPAAAALDARMVLTRVTSGQREQRLVPVGDCELRAGELVLGLSLPQAPAGFGSCYVKHGRVSQDRATLGVAVALTREPDDHCSAVSIRICGITEKQFHRADAVESLLSGVKINNKLIQAATTRAQETVSMQGDELAAADYRRQVLGVLLPRAIERAWIRAGGSA
jgi:CO/xanthine dehydrogenase FAD-binding subunit